MPTKSEAIVGQVPGARRVGHRRLGLKVSQCAKFCGWVGFT